MMNRHVFSLLSATILIAASIQSAAAQAVLQRCEKPMAEANAMVEQVASCAKALAVQSAALKELEKTAVPVETSRWVVISTGVIPAEMAAAASIHPMDENLTNYYAYTAYVNGNANFCMSQPSIGWQYTCRQAYYDLHLARASRGDSANFISVCSTPATKDDGKDDRGKCCQLAVEYRDQPDACSKFGPQCMPDAGSCQAWFGSLAGRTEDCNKIVPTSDGECSDAAECRMRQEECRGTALFVRADKAKNKALCGTSERCRVLMGDGQAVVRELAATLRKTEVGRWFINREWQNAVRKKIVEPKSAKVATAAQTVPVTTTIKGFSCDVPLGTEGNRKATSTILTSARLCFTDIEAALSRIDLATIRKIDAQQEVLSRLELRLNSYIDSGAASKAPTPSQTRGK